MGILWTNYISDGVRGRLRTRGRDLIPEVCIQRSEGEWSKWIALTSEAQRVEVFERAFSECYLSRWRFESEEHKPLWVGSTWYGEGKVRIVYTEGSMLVVEISRIDALGKDAWRFCGVDRDRDRSSWPEYWDNATPLLACCLVDALGIRPSSFTGESFQITTGESQSAQWIDCVGTEGIVFRLSLAEKEGVFGARIMLEERDTDAAGDPIWKGGMLSLLYDLRADREKHAAEVIAKAILQHHGIVDDEKVVSIVPGGPA